ncbi:MAG TPA: isoprenylcysteine carboxylmethyltransferase family protein [Verrucomicrobiae bacterium]
MQAQTRGRSLELKVPPLVVVMIAALLIWVGAVYLPEFSFRFRFQSVLGWVIGVLGFIGCFLGFLEFRRSKTTLNPTKPGTSSSLVQTGIYRHTRNPMYLGFLLMLVAWAIVMGNVISFLVLPGFVIYLNRFQIQPEERALTSIFGDEFTAYRSGVRRWI